MTDTEERWMASKDTHKREREDKEHKGNLRGIKGISVGSHQWGSHKWGLISGARGPGEGNFSLSDKISKYLTILWAHQDS